MNKQKINKENDSGTKYLVAHVRYLKSIKADPILIRDIELVVSLLRNPVAINILKEMQDDISQKQKPCKLDIVDYAYISLDEIDKLIIDDTTPRTVLATIGSKRFGLTTSEISKASKKKLQETLQKLIDNERTHLAISRMASTEKTGA